MQRSRLLASVKYGSAPTWSRWQWVTMTQSITSVYCPSLLIREKFGNLGTQVLS